MLAPRNPLWAGRARRRLPRSSAGKMQSGIQGSTAAPAVVRCALAADPERARSLDSASVVRRPDRRDGAAGCARGGRAPGIDRIVPAQSHFEKWDRHPAWLRAGFQSASVSSMTAGWKPAVGQAGSLSRYPALSSQTDAQKAAGLPPGRPEIVTEESPPPRPAHMCAIMLSPNAEHLISVAPSISRARS